MVSVSGSTDRYQTSGTMTRHQCHRSRRRAAGDTKIPISISPVISVTSITGYSYIRARTRARVFLEI
jgi:hypothetical protein